MMRPTLFFGVLLCAGASLAESVRCGDLSASFDPASGILTLAKGGKVFASAPFAEAGKVSCDRLAGGGAFEPGLMLRIGPGENRVSLREGSPFVFIRRDPRNMQSPSNRVEAVALSIDLGIKPEKIKGIGSGGLFTLARNPGQHVFTALADPSTGGGVVAGLVRIDGASGVLTTKVADGKVALTLRNDYGCAVPTELEAFGGDWWAVGIFNDIREGLEAYASEFARVNQIKLPRVPVGYMSWYSGHGGGALNERIAVELAQYLAATYKDYGYDFLQIDDGWQNGTRGNGPFKDFSRVRNGPYTGGMRPVAERIRSLGLTPGLWLLPFGIDHKDPSLQAVAHLAAKRSDGTPYEVGWSGTALDLTKPEAIDYVKSLIRRIVKEWGYTYLKLDGLYSALGTKQTYPARSYKEDDFGDAILADKTKSNMQAARAGLKAVREAAGPGRFILGCCAAQNERSLGMCMGLVDAMRVGPDSCNQWGPSPSSVVGGVRASASVYFMNGRIWWNDPDGIYLRETMPLNEIQCFAGWVTLTGMLNNQSDWPPSCKPDRVEMLKRTMPSHQLTSVRPVDFLENDPARIWVLTYDVSGNKHTVVGLFNWTDKVLEIGTTAAKLGMKPEGRYAGYEFWSNSLLEPFQGELKKSVPARSALIIAVREANQGPVVLSTSRHITQGAVDLLDEKWNVASKTLSGMSKVVGNDPYEIRVATGEKGWKASGVEIPEEDRKAGVTVSIAQEKGLIRLKIVSPETRTLRWSLKLQE
jgi:hypothetical protein